MTREVFVIKIEEKIRFISEVERHTPNLDSRTENITRSDVEVIHFVDLVAAFVILFLFKLN